MADVVGLDAARREFPNLLKSVVVGRADSNAKSKKVSISNKGYFLSHRRSSEVANTTNHHKGGEGQLRV